MLMSVFVASLAVLSLSGSMAAQHGQAGWLTLHEWWIGLAVVIVVAVIWAGFGIRNRLVSYEEPSRYDVLVRRLNGLDESECRELCRWLAQDTRVHQQALEDALDANEGEA